jgi:type VI secretion system protein ImpI
MDWAQGPPSQVPVPPPPPPPRPAPRRPDLSPQGPKSWDGVPGDPWPQAREADRAAPADFAPARSDADSPAFFIRQLARAAGLPDDVFLQKEPSELAQQLGAILRLMTENLIQLLTARGQAKRFARVSTHTSVQALDNNPLKFYPAQDALRVMFGSANPGYLDGYRAIEQSFSDLKAHQVKTFSAMQQALKRLMTDLDPQAIERDSDDGGGIAGLLMSRKAKLWDAYEARWNSTIGREPDGLVQAFLRHFAEAYDREGG